MLISVVNERPQKEIDGNSHAEIDGNSHAEIKTTVVIKNIMKF